MKLFYKPVNSRCSFDKVLDSYPRYLDATIGDVATEEDCAAKCNGYDNFICRSFAYYTLGSQCLISGDDRGNLD